MRTSKLLLTFVLWLVLQAITAQCAEASAPAWAEGLVNTRLPAYGFDTPAVCLLDETHTTVTDSGEIKTYRRLAYKILTRDGLDLSWVRLSYDGETKISDLKAWNLKMGGVVHEVARKDALETQLAGASGALFEDTKSLILLIPQVEVGSVVAYEYERRHRPYVLQDFSVLQRRYPILRSRFELQLPSGWEFQHRILRHAEVQPREIARNNWAWELTDLAAIPREEGMPPLASLSAIFVVTYFPSSSDLRNTRGEILRTWDDFAAWTNRLIQDRFTPSAQMAEMARQLGSTQALAEFVQKKIRYAAIEIGIGGYQPHFAEETFRNQYGDCKDKVTLFRSLMKALNREVYPVLIDADGGGLVKEFPSPLYFNHMIAAVPLAAGEVRGPAATLDHPELGRLLLFDPTDEHTTFGQLPSALHGTTAVLVRGDRGYLIETPVGVPVSNRVLRAGNFQLGANGNLTGDLSESYWGELAIRETERLTGQNHDQWIRGAERRIGGVLPGALVKKFGVSRLNQPNPLREDYSIDAPVFGEAAGELLLFQPAILRSPAPRISFEESRNYPYQFSYLRSYGSVFSFQLPDGYAVETVPQPQEIETAFGHYKAEITVDGNILRYVSLYEIRKLEVPAQAVPELQKFFDFVESASRTLLV